MIELNKIKLDEERYKKLLMEGAVILISVVIFFLNIETIYAYNQEDWFNLFAFIIYKYNMISIITILLSLIFVYSLTGNYLFSYTVLSVVSLLFGIVNRVFIGARGCLLTLSEIRNYKEALGLEHSYSGIVNCYLVILLILNILFGVVIHRMSFTSLNRIITLRKIAVRLCVLFGVSAAYLFIYFVLLKNLVISMLVNNYQIGALITLNESFFEGYYSNVAYDKVELIKEKYEGHKSSGNERMETPNIIVIMSEAYWDLNNLKDDISITPDPMQTFYELSNNCITGQCGVDIYGGGTNISEWEFNTGCPYGNPYGVPSEWNELENNKCNTLITYLKELGYNTISLHGYRGDFYKRDSVYPNMGFDCFYTIDDFENDAMYNGYISDDSLTKEIIYRFEEQKKREDKPVYLFTVSIQNHIKDMGDKEDISADVDADFMIDYGNLKIPNEYKKRIYKYVSGISMTNDALKRLIEYFDEYGEDTIIVFFGDHAPEFIGLETDIYKQYKFRTPYMIWTNYVNDYEYLGDINLSYLSTIILDYLNMPDTLLTCKNKYLMRKYSINTKFERASDYIEDTKKQEYLDDMLDERTIYCYENDKNRVNRYLWDIVK